MSIIRDAVVSDAALEVQDAQRWTSLLEKASGDSVDTAIGGGYVARPFGLDTFEAAVSGVPAVASVVVLVGGAADRSVPAQTLTRAATKTMAALAARAPGAQLVVVGPVIGGGASTDQVVTVRTSLRAAARAADATWVDPITAQWISGAAATTSASDLTAANEQSIAQRIRTVLASAVTAAAAQG